jgi:hypothetical protein
MNTQKLFSKFLLLTIITGVVAFAPQYSHAGDVQVFSNDEAISVDSSQDSYLKELVDNLKTLEVDPAFQKALADLKSSASECSSLKEWAYSKPDLSGNFVVKKSVSEGTPGSSSGPTYTVTLSYPDVSKDSFNAPIEIFSNPSLLTEVSLAKFYKRSLEKVIDAAHMNRLTCTRMVSEKKEEQKVSSN